MGSGCAKRSRRRSGTRVASAPSACERLRHFGKRKIAEAHRHTELSAECVSERHILVSKLKCKCRRVVLTGQELINQRIERESAPNRTLADRLPKRKRIHARLHAQGEGFGERADNCVT